MHVFSPLYRSKCFRLSPLADMFVPTPTWLLWEEFNLAVLHKDCSFTFIHMSIARYSFIQLSELRSRGQNENATSSKQQERGFEHRVSRLEWKQPKRVPCLYANKLKIQRLLAYEIGMCPVQMITCLQRSR